MSTPHHSHYGQAAFSMDRENAVFTPVASSAGRPATVGCAPSTYRDAAIPLAAPGGGNVGSSLGSGHLHHHGANTATPLHGFVNESRFNPATPEKKRQRTSHASDDTTQLHMNRRLLVSRVNPGTASGGRPGHSQPYQHHHHHRIGSAGVAPSLGRASQELSNHFQGVNVGGRNESEGRPSVGPTSLHAPPPSQHAHPQGVASVSSSSSCYHSTPVGLHVPHSLFVSGGGGAGSGLGCTTNSQSLPPIVQSPQCHLPSGSSPTLSWAPSGPGFDPFRQSFSVQRGQGQGGTAPHGSNCGLEASQTDTEFSTYVARRIVTEFREVMELGSGSFGSVILHEDLNSGDFVAIKTSHPLASKDQLHRARRERNILNALRGFPHIVHLYHSWEEGKPHPVLHLQMQYCPNGTLAGKARKMREEHTRWSEEEILSLMGQMAIALDATHSASIAHVDFKPDNILIDEYESYLLTDFGCSLPLDSTTGRPRDFPNAAGGSSTIPQQYHHGGHASYASQPQHSHCVSFSQALNDTQCSQFSQQSHDEGDKRYLAHDMMNEKRHYKAGDMFSFGMTLYELMSSTALPGQGEAYEQMRNRTHLKELLDAGYSPELVQLVLMLIHREPLQRPTARDVLEFPKLRVNTTSLTLNATSTKDVAQYVTHHQITPSMFQYHQTCFEVAHYLLRATFREVHGMHPPTVWRLHRDDSCSQTLVDPGLQHLGSPMRQAAVRASQGEVVFRTPTMPRREL